MLLQLLSNSWAFQKRNRALSSICVQQSTWQNPERTVRTNVNYLLNECRSFAMQPWLLGRREYCTWQWPFRLKPANLRNWKGVSIKLPDYYVAFPHWHRLNSLSLWLLSHLGRPLERIRSQGHCSAVGALRTAGLFLRMTATRQGTLGHFQGRDIAAESRSCCPFRLGHTPELTNYIRGSRQQEFSTYHSSLKLRSQMWHSRTHAVNGVTPDHLHRTRKCSLTFLQPPTICFYAKNETRLNTELSRIRKPSPTVLQPIYNSRGREFSK